MRTQSQWLNYVFDVLRRDANWSEESGIYIICGVNPQNQWVPIYVGQADSFRSRIPRHEQWSQALALGASHVLAMVVATKADRDRIEQHLIQTYQPPLNVQHR